MKEGSQDSLTQKNSVRTCLQVHIHGQWMLPSLMRSFVGRSSIRELGPPAFHELTVDLLLPVCYSRIHTHRPLAGQYFSTKRNRSLKRNGRWNALSNFPTSNLSLFVTIFSSVLANNPRKSWIWACCNSWGNTCIKMRRIRANTQDRMACEVPELRTILCVLLQGWINVLCSRSMWFTHIAR